MNTGPVANLIKTHKTHFSQRKNGNIISFNSIKSLICRHTLDLYGVIPLSSYHIK